MRKRSTYLAMRKLTFAFLATSLSFTSVAAAGETEGLAVCKTTQSAEGENCFALSTSLPTATQQRNADLLIFVDTSASQTGPYQRDSLKVLKQVLKGLSADDRVRICAIDLDSESLHKGFVSPASVEALTAVDKLSQRISLGSTDMKKMLAVASKSFRAGNSNRNRNVVYIGDGISRAGILHTQIFTQAVTNLVDKNIAVSAYAIGPERNTGLLAALANNTGGNLLIDSDEPSAVAAGATALIETVHSSVLWPSNVSTSSNVLEKFPLSCPPMRVDRDTIVYGTMSDISSMELTVDGTMDGEAVSHTWTVAPEVASEQMSFLPKLIANARSDGGMTLPTIGSEGLREYARMINETSAEIDLLSDGHSAAQVDSMAGQPTARTVAYRPQDNPFGDAEDAAEAVDNPFGDATEPAADAPAAGSPFGDAGAAMTEEAGSPFGSDTADAAVDSPFGDAEIPAAEEASSPFGTDAPDAADTASPFDSDTADAAADSPAATDSPFGDADLPAADEAATMPVETPTADDPFGDATVAEPTNDVADAADDPFGSADATVVDEPLEDVPSEMGSADNLFLDEVVEPETSAPREMGNEFAIEPNQQQPMSSTPEFIIDGSNIVPEQQYMPMRSAPSESEISRILRESEREARGMILDAEAEQRLINEKLRKQVQYESERAMQELRTNPSAAIERLKNMIEVVDQTPELYPDTAAGLRQSLESSLLSARQRKLDFDQAEQLASVNAATARQINNDLLNYERREEKLARLINQFTSLMEEQNLVAAEQVAETAYIANMYTPEAVATTERAHIARAMLQAVQVKRIKEFQFMAALHEINRSAIPISGNPPLVFPDAEEWIEKKARRAKYQSVRLTGSANDEKILKVLQEPSDLVFDEEAFVDVKRQLEDSYGINIVLDTSAIDDQLDNDTLITAGLRGISLRNGLRTMLKQYNATYIVRDEVLLIISLDDASLPEYFVTDVYNVGDLVAPRFNPGGGIGGQQGGQQGGGFGGQGGGGGGFGGQQGGGGGGVFCIQDDAAGFMIRESGSDSAPVAAAPVVPAKPAPQRIEVAAGENPTEAWTTYFAANDAAPADVRETVRELVAENRHEEVIGLINGAIRNDQLQSAWMFEAMGLSMELLGKPKQEIERVVMSAVDLSQNANDAMVAAMYLGNSGMTERALSVLHDIALLKPERTEPYEIAFRLAQRAGDSISGESLQWVVTGILSQEWPNNPELVREAGYRAAAIKTQLADAGKTAELADFEKQLMDAQHRDVRVLVTWTGDADLDLYIEEPGGTICSRLNPRTTAGGVYFGDVYSKGTNESGLMQESYVLPEGFAGDYRLIVKRVTGQVTAGKVNVDIALHYNSESEAGMARPVELDNQGAIVTFALDKGRRADELDQHTIETLVEKKLAVQKTILAQQLATDYSGDAASDYYNSIYGGGPIGNGPTANNVNLQNRRTAGVVGYQPNIEFFPEGTFFTVNHATTSDRLHVMISVSPFFTAITSVSNFNVLGNADNAGTGGAGAGTTF